MKMRPRARTLRLIIDSLPFATDVFLKLEEGRNATGFTRCVRGDEVSSGASTSCSGYAPLRGGLSVYIGLRLRLIDPARDHHDSTEQRLESGLDENQIFGAIVFFCVSKMQHGDRPFVSPIER